MMVCGDCCRSVLLRLFVKNLILVWLVSSVLGSPSLRQAQANSLAMRCGVPVPSIISSLPFAACVIEVPRLYTAGLHNVVAQLLLSGVPVCIAGESADVKATVCCFEGRCG